MSIKVKIEARAKAVHDARAISNKADAEKRDMSAEESANYDALMAKVDELAEEINALKSADAGEDRDDEQSEDEKKKAALEAAEREVEEDKRFIAGRRSSSMRPGAGEGRSYDARSEYERRRASPAYANAFRNWVQNGREHRDLALGTNTAGGYMVTPTKLSEQFIVALNNLVFMRNLATIETLTDAKSLGVPTLTTDVSDADWTAEVPASDIEGDASMVTGRRDLNPSLLSKLALVSHLLLLQSSRAESVVMQRLSYKFGVSEEKGFLTGDGDGKPLGVFTADADGIPTSRDVTATSQTVFTADELIDTAYSIPQQYQKSKSFGWILHRNSVARARKLKNGNGDYIWQQGMAIDRPDTLLGFPIYQSEYAPNTYTTGNYVACIGDFAFYTIVDVANMEIQRLVERFALKNQIGFFGRRYVDGAPTLANAFARLKLA